MNNALVQIGGVNLEQGKNEAISALTSCWRTIGTWGDRSCPALTECQFCSGCKVYSSAQTVLLAREIPRYEEPVEVNSYESANEAALHLCVSVAGHLWALPLDCLSRVAPPRAIHSVPHTRNILGLTAVDGQLLPVLDLGKVFLGTPSQHSANQWFVIFALDGGAIAAPVDQVLGILSVEIGSIRPLPERGMKNLTLIPIGLVAATDEILRKTTLQAEEVIVTDSVTLYEQLSNSLVG